MSLTSQHQFKKTNNKTGLVATCSFIYHDQFKFNNVGIYKRWDAGFYVSWPYRKTPVKKIVMVYPTDVNLEHDLEREIITAYTEYLKKMTF